MAARRSASKRTVARSSKTGRFVTKKFAATHKNTTEVERVKLGGRKKGR